MTENTKSDARELCQPKMVRLRNGAEELRQLVSLTMMHLNMLQGMLSYEVVMACRDRKHVVFGGGKGLEHLLTMNEDGTAYVHDSIRNIIVSAAEGDGMDMAIVNPVKGGCDE